MSAEALAKADVEEGARKARRMRGISQRIQCSRKEPLTRPRFRVASTLSHKGEGRKKQEDVHLTRPFEGVKILDFTQVLAGPYASYQLALLGIDVIKVERREGEDMRRTPLSREWAERGLAPGWQAINGNKRSLTLDL